MTILEIQRLVASRCDVTLLDLVSDRRGRYIARPRQIGMWLARHLTTSALTDIGRAFGDRDHTTVIHALRVIDGEIASGNGWGKRATQIRNELAEEMA